ncbi:hypothetical protein M9H77_12236 [Catharanthus roseus]|uniref:Uncharacterized protein n=1 Tax=Catharanthus roseus TaxID=4058 RepID=A0ACC0BGT7_CATRO|nr:hypothetical protein M9H77_12236 [Catharanthus roseus]
MLRFNLVAAMHSILIGYTPISVSYNTGLIVGNDVGVHVLCSPPQFGKVEAEERQLLLVEKLEVDVVSILLVVKIVWAFILNQGKIIRVNSLCNHVSKGTRATKGGSAISIDDKTFKLDEVVANQSVTIEHMIEGRLTSNSPVVIPNVSGDILRKIVKYCKHVLTKSSFGENDVELKAFISQLVNDDEETLFRLLVVVDYLAMKRLLSLAFEEFFDLIKCKDPVHIRKIFKITLEFSLEDRKGCEALILGLSTK